MSDDTGSTTKKGWSAHLGKVALVLAGFAVGGLVFGIGSCTSGGEGDGHAAHADASSSAAEATIWTCAMHPQIRQPEAGQCPICGMDLIPVTPSAGGHNDSATRLVLSERARALARLRTVEVHPQPDAAADVRLLGRVEPNETSLRTITAWTGGRIDRLHVNVTGQKVVAGQVIATLYSPEVFAAHQDLLVARKQVAELAQSPESSRRAAESALNAARERLRLVGVPDDELARMETQSQPTRALAIRTPFGGTVIERLATEGAYVSTGAPLYRIANLGSLWVQLDAYESDLPRLSLKQKVRVRVNALPGQDFEGTVTFIDPTLDAQRRTSRVRVEVDNRDGRLRPGMFAEAQVAATARATERSPLVVPATAPLFTGRRAIVYVELEDAEGLAYEPRTVRLGPRLGDYYPVVAGLAEGERVVTQGAFALDADLQIRGGASMMTSPDDTEDDVWDAAVVLPESERVKLAPVVAAYLSLQKALAADDLPASTKAAGLLGEAVAAVKLTQPRQAVAAWPEVAKALSGHSQHVAGSRQLEGARTGFEALSEGMALLLRSFGNPTGQPLHLAFCPMASGSQGAAWIQDSTAINNSYFGASMRTCGEVKQSLAPGAFLTPTGTEKKPRAPAAAGGHQH